MTQNVGIVIVEYEIKEIDRGVNGERGRTMDTHKFFVEKMRFHLKEQDTLVFVGWFLMGIRRNIPSRHIWTTESFRLRYR